MYVLAWSTSDEVLATTTCVGARGEHWTSKGVFGMIIIIIIMVHSQRGPSRRCTTMSTVDSTPPELANRTGGIVS